MFLYKNIDLIGAGTALTLFGVSMSDLNLIAQTLAGFGAFLVALVTVVFRIKNHFDQKDDE